MLNSSALDSDPASPTSTQIARISKIEPSISHNIHKRLLGANLQGLLVPVLLTTEEHVDGKRVPGRVRLENLIMHLIRRHPDGLCSFDGSVNHVLGPTHVDMTVPNSLFQDLRNIYTLPFQLVVSSDIIREL